VERWGERCAEVEAIPATELRGMVRTAIESNISAGSWKRLRQIESQERQQWAAFMEQLKT
jgi:hypothetical protein